jgi:ATP-dependent Clp protease adaptor protein ClpS
MNQTVLDPKIEEAGPGNGNGARWMVVIFNNETNTFDEVIGAIVRATGCDAEEAAIEAWEAHHYGKAPVHFASRPECEDIASVISTVGVKTEVTPEWED